MELTNFQGFRGTHTVRLAPITLIMGPNSAGKSSISRALRLLQQSGDGFRFVGPKVDLVEYNNVVFGQGRSPDETGLAVRVDMDLMPLSPRLDVHGLFPKNLEFIQSSRTPENCLVSFEIKQWPFDYDDHEFFVTIENSLIYPNSSGGTDIVRFGSEDGESTLNITDSASLLDLLVASMPTNLREFANGELLENGPIDLVDLVSSNFEANHAIDGVFRLDPVHGEEADVLTSMVTTSLLQLWDKVSQNIRLHKRAIRHLIPLRDTPQRVAVRTESEIAKDSARSDPKMTNTWLSYLTGGRYSYQSQELSFDQAGAGFVVVTSHIKDEYTGAVVGFQDLGTGIGQVLPVLQALSSKTAGIRKEAILLIEQPELHLHHAMQSSLMEVIHEAVVGGWVEQVLLETHSEAMLLRLQKLIREGRIPHDFATVVFVEPEPLTEGSQDIETRSNWMYNIDFLPSGNLENEMPLSFAGLRLRDLF